MTAKQKTCVMVKPDGVGTAVVGRVLDRLERENLRLLCLKMARPTAEMMEGFYQEHKDKEFFPRLMRFMLSGPVVVTVWEGLEAVSRVRQIIGSTDSRKAAVGTLRHAYGTDERRNLIHASDSPESAAREIRFFFSPDDIAPYDPDNWKKVELLAPVPSPQPTESNQRSAVSDQRLDK